MICEGKTRTAAALSQHYDVPTLTIDDVVIAAISSNSAIGTKAKQLCADATRKYINYERRQMTSYDTDTATEERLTVDTR